MKIVGKHIRTSNHSQRSKSWQKSKDNVLGNKKHANPKKFDQGGSLDNWCDADANAHSTNGVANMKTVTLIVKNLYFKGKYYL